MIRRITSEDAMDHSVYLEELPQEKEPCLFCSGQQVDCTGECVELPHYNEALDFNDK